MARRRLVSFAAAFALVGGGVLASAPSAGAGVVPNFYYCSRWTNKCVQTNPPHNYSVPNSCHWVWTWYGSGMSTSGCNYWW